MILAQSIALSLFLGFFFFEFTGLVAGGLVAPGYFALYCDQPWLLAQTLLAAVVTFCLARLLGRWVVLYGRRRFIVTILLGFCLQWLAGGLIWGLDLAATRIDALGYIIPGLVANELERQGIGKTLVSLLIITCAVRLLLRLSGILHN
jgi:poly-gamma-glutamate biosynthesis protein PgsC/CapC